MTAFEAESRKRRTVRQPRAPRPPATKDWYGTKLVDRGELTDGTRLWVDPSAPADEVTDIVDAYERTPPKGREPVEELHVVNSVGPEFKVGSTDFTEGGHWRPGGSEVTIFMQGPGNRRWVTNFRDADRVVAHEVGHATFDKLEKKESDTRMRIVNDEQSRVDSYVKDAKAQRDRIDAEFAPKEAKIRDEHDRTYERYRTSLDRLLDMYSSHPDYDRMNAEHKAIKKELAAKRSKLNRIRTKWQREINAVGSGYDKADRLIRERTADAKAKDPDLAKLERFRTASDEEGGLTTYSESYRVDKHGHYDTENFAEATKIWYSTDYHDVPPRNKLVEWGFYSEADLRAQPGRIAITDREYQRRYPKTYEAWKDIMEPEIEGHAVPLKFKPKERGKAT